MDEADLSGFFRFINGYSSLVKILVDRNLAALGDAYVNFIYSLALSMVARKPVGRKLDSLTLALALRKTDVRRLLPKRMDRHKQADAAEALIVYGWLSGAVSMKEATEILARGGKITENLIELLNVTLKRLRFKTNG